MAEPSPRRCVLHVVDALRPHGMQLGLIEIIERTRDQFESTVLCLRELGECAERLTRAGVAVHCLHKSDRHEWTLWWRIFRFLRQRRIDVVHTYNWGAIDALPAAILARVPIRIHSEHGSGLSECGAIARRRSRARRWLSPQVTSFVAVSGALAQWLTSEVGIDAAKVKVVPNAVDPARFLAAGERAEGRAKLGYDAQEIVIGAVGRLEPVKQFDVLLDAFARLRQHDPRVRLVIVGDGPQRVSLEAGVQRFRLADVVRLPGHQFDVRPWLAAMDLFVLPSAREGISRAALEAMASELPVIASAVAGNLEILSEAGDGILVPSGDAPALSGAMQQCCNDAQLRRRLGEAARRRVLRSFSIDSAVRAYTQLYSGSGAGH